MKKLDDFVEKDVCYICYIFFL